MNCKQITAVLYELTQSQFLSDKIFFDRMSPEYSHFSHSKNQFFDLFKGSPLSFGVYLFFRKIKTLKNTPNHRRDPLKNSKRILFQKSKCTHVCSINLKGKVSDLKNVFITLMYFCTYSYGTPCTMKICVAQNFLKKAKINIFG